MNTNSNITTQKQNRVVNLLRLMANQRRLKNSINPFEINNIQCVLRLRWKHKSTKEMFNRMADFVCNPVTVHLSDNMQMIYSLCADDLNSTLKFLREYPTSDIDGVLTMTYWRGIDNGLEIWSEGSSINDLIAVMFKLYRNHSDTHESHLRSLIMRHLETIYCNHLQSQAA